MKNGMAKSAKLSRPVAILCARVEVAGMMGIVVSNAARPDSPKPTAMGTPKAKKVKNETSRTATSSQFMEYLAEDRQSVD